MVSEKRKASSDIPRAPRQQAHLDTIETLEPLECKYNATTLTKDNFEKAFPSIPLAQQHVDLWTIFQAPCFKHGSTKAGLFDSWLRIHAFTLEQVVQWRQGPLSNTLPQWKPSEAKITTRVVKKMRMLSIEVAAVSDREELETKCLKMELDYSMLMYATQLHNVDNMIPDHNQRIEHLVQRLSPKAANPLALEEGQRSNVLEMDNQEQEENIIRDIAVSFLQQPDPNLPTMIGHDDIRKRMNEQMRIPLLFSHLLQPNEKVGFQSFLLFGPPGTGKTLFAQSLAAQRGMTFFKVQKDALTSKYVGDTEKILRALSEEAKHRMPCIIFFDEIDGLTRRRGSAEADYDRRTKTQLLEILNSLRQEASIFVVAATNRPWDMDTAFISRFQQKIYFGMPRKEDYVAMIQKSLENKRTTIKDDDLGDLCRGLHNYSNREISDALGILHINMLRDLMASTCFVPLISNGRGLMLYEPCDTDNAAKVERPFDEWSVERLRPRAITRSHLQVALSAVKASITEDDMRQYEEWGDKFGVRSV